ncbi:sulfotransferase [Marinicellulosiphila megalodicopiae]|uniref:sulfotransferase n=1 Tax=Marinicellulosiphila megalodicopiae TaxID=2724896 RepID=UPI003BAE7F7A
MSKLFIIGLPRTGTTSISATLLEHFTVAHTAYTKHAFHLADVISDCPCFSDYQQLDALFPDAKFVYLQRGLDQWVPSIQMLLTKMIPAFNSTNYINPILKRSFEQTFDLNIAENSLDITHLTSCYKRHEQEVMTYFEGKNTLLSIDISQPNSLPSLLEFLGLPFTGDEVFPHLNIGKRVDNWKEIKHSNKVNPNAAGREGRKFFDY